ncbi:MAG: hypothetical protein AAFY17_02865 [Cyanobacteria bacterium J06642_11]
MGEFGPLLQLLSQPLAETLLSPSETAILWGLHHPYWLGAIAISLIFLIQLLLSGITQFLRYGVRWIGRSPLSLGRWLLHKTASNNVSQDINQKTLTNILTRLESLQQEQISLMTDLKTILAAQDPEDFP